MTEPQFLLDSNVLIYILRDANGLETKRLEACDWGEAVTSAIAYAEVIRGIPADDSLAHLAAERLFEIVEVLPFDVVAAKGYLRVPFKRARFDRLIAAHALSLGLTLVTNNEGDFADISGLKVENWTQ